MRVVFLGLFFLASIILFSSCATTTRTVGGAAIGFSSGFKEDVITTLGAIHKADEWVKENYW